MQNNQQSQDKRQAVMDAYAALVDRLSPKSKLGQGCLRAFWVGGVICMLGQAFIDLALALIPGLTFEAAGTLSSIVLVFLAMLLTGLGVFDKLGQYAGAGTLVPITGFANAMVSPAIEFRPEGLVMGVGAKLFSLAGPVLTYGISASVVVGLIYVIFGL